MVELIKEKLELDKEVYIRVKVKPNADKDEILEAIDETLKIKISAVPEKNKANKKLIKFLSKVFDVKKQNITIVSGSKDRIKLVKIKK